jgi:hypothetical protein
MPMQACDALFGRRQYLIIAVCAGGHSGIYSGGAEHFVLRVRILVFLCDSNRQYLRRGGGFVCWSHIIRAHSEVLIRDTGTACCCIHAEMISIYA